MRPLPPQPAPTQDPALPIRRKYLTPRSPPAPASRRSCASPSPSAMTGRCGFSCMASCQVEVQTLLFPAVWYARSAKEVVFDSETTLSCAHCKASTACASNKRPTCHLRCHMLGIWLQRQAGGPLRSLRLGAAHNGGLEHTPQPDVPGALQGFCRSPCSSVQFSLDLLCTLIGRCVWLSLEPRHRPVGLSEGNAVPHTSFL